MHGEEEELLWSLIYEAKTQTLKTDSDCHFLPYPPFHQSYQVIWPVFNPLSFFHYHEFLRAPGNTHLNE